MNNVYIVVSDLDIIESVYSSREAAEAEAARLKYLHDMYFSVIEKELL